MCLVLIVYIIEVVFFYVLFRNQDVPVNGKWEKMDRLTAIQFSLLLIPMTILSVLFAFESDDDRS